jgi:hypothetical protein
MAGTCGPNRQQRAPALRGELLGATAYVTDDPIESEALARQAVEIGRASGNSGLELMALHAVGQALVQQGRTVEGMSLLDEAMAAVVGGEAGDQLTVAQMSCMTMVVCGCCFNLERATQWVQSLQGLIDRYGCPFLFAECRTYYGRVLFENGDWGAAAVIELLGQAAIELGNRDVAVEQGRRVVALGAASNCNLIVANGERLVGHALASTDPAAARRHLEVALGAFAQAGIPYRAAQTRLLLARLWGVSDREVAVSEAQVAFSVFEDLGARGDADAQQRCCAIWA